MLKFQYLIAESIVPVSGQTGRATDLNEALFNHLVSLAEPIA